MLLESRTTSGTAGVLWAADAAVEVARAAGVLAQLHSFVPWKQSDTAEKHWTNILAMSEVTGFRCDAVFKSCILETKGR